MRRAFRRAAGLMLAGAIGMATPALARSDLGAVPGLTLARPSDGQAQLERMKVELAWLADLTCFGQQVEAHAVGSSLEVRGNVPDDNTREHVLRVARQNCFLPVLDVLTVSGAPATPTTSAVEMRQAASEILVRNFGPRAAGFEILVQDGRVSIGGSVASVEDKVAISRCLRQLPHCVCVINRLSVMPTTHAGQTVTLVSADGRQMVAGALPPGGVAPTDTARPKGSLAEDDELRLPRVADVRTPYPLPPAPTLTLPSGLPTQRPQAIITAATGSQEPSRRTQPVTYTWYPAPTSDAPPPPPATSVAPPAPTVALVSPPPCTNCAQRVVPRTAPMVAEPPPRFPFLSRITASRVTTPPAATNSATSGQPQPASFAPGQGNWPPAHANASTPPAASPPPRQQMQLVAAPATQTQAALWPKNAPPAVPTISAARLQQVAQTASGGMARKVQVITLPNRNLVVRVVTANATAQALADRLLQLPEMSTPGVRLEVVVAP